MWNINSLGGMEPEPVWEAGRYCLKMSVWDPHLQKWWDALLLALPTGRSLVLVWGCSSPPTQRDFTPLDEMVCSYPFRLGTGLSLLFLATSLSHMEELKSRSAASSCWEEPAGWLRHLFWVPLGCLSGEVHPNEKKPQQGIRTRLFPQKSWKKSVCTE